MYLYMLTVDQIMSPSLVFLAMSKKDVKYFAKQSYRLAAK